LDTSQPGNEGLGAPPCAPRARCDGAKFGSSVPCSLPCPLPVLEISRDNGKCNSQEGKFFVQIQGTEGLRHYNRGRIVKLGPAVKKLHLEMQADNSQTSNTYKVGTEARGIPKAFAQILAPYGYYPILHDPSLISHKNNLTCFRCPLEYPATPNAPRSKHIPLSRKPSPGVVHLLRTSLDNLGQKCRGEAPLYHSQPKCRDTSTCGK